jgi:hypothetical protein
LEIGYDVYRPAIEGGRYDMIFDTGEALQRVQCKWAPLANDCVVIRSYTARRARSGLVRKPYVAGDFDVLAAYCAELERCYVVPYSAIDGALHLSLRVSPTRNNQHVGVRLASHYEFGARLAPVQLGPIAQLGERCDGIAEAAGSSPAGST